jgi:GTP 3',8-cyclase
MFDSFNRPINYLRISVTDRCNLRCTYCMPAEGVTPMSHADILSFEEILEVVHYGVLQGINKVRITGGEPLVRKGVVSLVGMLARVSGIEDLSMTTNGIMLEEFASRLSEAGLKRINISLDTMDSDRFREITRGGDLRKVMRGVEAAAKAGLQPVKINCVIRQDTHEPDAEAVAVWGQENGYEVRFIRMMDLHVGQFSQVIGGEGGNCNTCNRIRLTADGRLIPCLFSDTGYPVRTMGVEAAFREAIAQKPACGSANSTGAFYNIGG